MPESAVCSVNNDYYDEGDDERKWKRGARRKMVASTSRVAVYIPESLNRSWQNLTDSL